MVHLCPDKLDRRGKMTNIIIYTSIILMLGASETGIRYLVFAFHNIWFLISCGLF